MMKQGRTLGGPVRAAMAKRAAASATPMPAAVANPAAGKPMAVPPRPVVTTQGPPPSQMQQQVNPVAAPTSVGAAHLPGYKKGGTVDCKPKNVRGWGAAKKK